MGGYKQGHPTSAAPSITRRNRRIKVAPTVAKFHTKTEYTPATIRGRRTAGGDAAASFPTST
ncbi:MAG: hypothetical protein DMG01_25455 [Acidobacteria bacterium]|nr:MAG: hypothetical protein DMG01_25455 [Acidobacteriota bacterium]